jgi:hypothetical protein
MWVQRLRRVPRLAAVLPILQAVLLAACVTRVADHVAAGQPPLCRPGAPDLGVVAVLPQVVWRADQKEPEARRAIAEASLRESFAELPCARVPGPGAMRGFGDWSARPEADTLRALAAEGVDTAILVRVEELTPLLAISIPVLWSSYSQVDLRLRVLDTRSGAVRLDVHRGRLRGGAFAVRGTGPLQAEMTTALRGLVEGDLP